MARTRQRLGHRSSDFRTTMTRFHLPRDQAWPTWPAAYSACGQYGPLANVQGRKEVWLGRKVEDPEQAAIFILWYTAEDLKNFLQSQACADFLWALPEHGDDEQSSSAVSGQLLQQLSPGNASSTPSPLAASRILTFYWLGPTMIVRLLEGRLTNTTLEVHYTGDSDSSSFRDSLNNELGDFIPSGIGVSLSGGRIWLLRDWAKLDTGFDNSSGSTADQSSRAVYCEFRRWNGYAGATPEREEAAAKNPAVRDAWAKQVARLVPPVTKWEQERWDLQLAKGE